METGGTRSRRKCYDVWWARRCSRCAGANTDAFQMVTAGPAGRWTLLMGTRSLEGWDCHILSGTARLNETGQEGLRSGVAEPSAGEGFFFRVWPSWPGTPFFWLLFFSLLQAAAQIKPLPQATHSKLEEGIRSCLGRAFLGGGSSNPRGGWLPLLMALSVVGDLCLVQRNIRKTGEGETYCIKSFFLLSVFFPSCLPQTPGISSKRRTLVPLSKTSSSAWANSDTELSVSSPLKKPSSNFHHAKVEVFRSPKRFSDDRGGCMKEVLCVIEQRPLDLKSTGLEVIQDYLNENRNQKILVRLIVPLAVGVTWEHGV